MLYDYSCKEMNMRNILHKITVRLLLCSIAVFMISNRALARDFDPKELDSLKVKMEILAKDNPVLYKEVVKEFRASVRSGEISVVAEKPGRSNEIANRGDVSGNNKEAVPAGDRQKTKEVFVKEFLKDVDKGVMERDLKEHGVSDQAAALRDSKALDGKVNSRELQSPNSREAAPREVAQPRESAQPREVAREAAPREIAREVAPREVAPREVTREVAPREIVPVVHEIERPGPQLKQDLKDAKSHAPKK